MMYSLRWTLRGRIRDRNPVRSRRVIVEGIAVTYQELGAGEPVILVHGLAASTLWWSRNIEPLARRYRVLAVDLPGFGALRRYRDSFALQRAAHWLRSFMKAVGIRRAHLIGHSMGGYICLRLAAAYPRSVRRLVLAAPAGAPLAASIFGEVVPLIGAVRFASPSFLPVLTYDALRAGPRMLLSTARDILQLNVSGELKAVRTRALLIWGERDRLVPLANGEMLRKALPRARMVVLPKAGHVVMYDRAEEFNRVVLAFLGGKHVGE